MISPQSRLILLALFLWPASASANDSAMDWLMKMNMAVQNKNYDGIFIYRHGDQLESMRIIHRARNGEHRERLVSLNGEAREVIRNDRDIICYLPAKKSVVIEHRKTKKNNFPALLPNRLDGLVAHYQIVLGGSDRVARRSTQLIIIKPKDAYRYGYYLWADKETGLLLRSSLVNLQGEVVEQFMFTNIEIGKKIKLADLKSRYSGKKWVWHREKEIHQSAEQETRWKVKNLPKGYTLSHRIMRNMPMGNMTVEHLVYSDGLAAISVFIEPPSKNSDHKMKGATGMGAVHAFGTVVNNHQITVVGEVPAATVALVGKSIAYE